jgi:hypothetical protein
MVEAEAVLAMSDEKPSGFQIGQEFDTAPDTVDPQSFINQ